MSDDRTQEPSPRRIREARERGMVAVSGELTAAVGLLAASAALGFCGDRLTEGILGVVRGGLSAETFVAADLKEFEAIIGEAIGSVAAPMAWILASTLLAILAAHQVQVGGLFVPGLARPDPARLRPGASGGAPGDRLGRLVGVVLRGAVLLVLTWWAIRGILRDMAAITDDDAGAMLRIAAQAVHASMFRLGLALLSVGLIHYAVQVRRLNARLRTTAEERREEQRDLEGDPGLRSRRRASRGRPQAVAVTGAEATSSSEAI